MTTLERRRDKRTQLNVPVKIRPQALDAQSTSAAVSGVTRDLSTSGIFIYSESALQPGAKLELVMMLPTDLGLGPGGWTLCQASVLRIEDQGGKRVGVAAALDRIDRLPELA